MLHVHWEPTDLGNGRPLFFNLSAKAIKFNKICSLLFERRLQYLCYSFDINLVCILAIDNFRILKFSLAARRRGHKQRKLNDHVYSFLFFMSSKPRYQAEFLNIKSGLLVILRFFYSLSTSQSSADIPFASFQIQWRNIENYLNGRDWCAFSQHDFHACRLTSSTNHVIISWQWFEFARFSAPLFKIVV